MTTLADIRADETLAAGIIITTPAAPNGQPQGTMGRLEIEVGEPVAFSLLTAITRTWALESAPTGARATIREARLVAATVPGVYRVTCTLVGGWTRTLELVAFTAEQLYPPPADPQVQRDTRHPELRFAIRAWLNDPTRTDDEIRNRLEIRP